MSGHSKWAQIKRQKESTDKKKGQLFSKLSRAITLAAREKGDDPNRNFQLRLAVEKAKSANMPLANVERAIKKGTGEIAGEQIEEILYEAYGPGGAAIIVKALTDNRNRTTSEIRNILSANGGRLGETNSVKWLFAEKGVLGLPIKNQEKVSLKAIEAGADDIEEERDELIIVTPKGKLIEIKKELEKISPVGYAEIKMVPKSKISLPGKNERQRLIKLVAVLSEHDDVENVFTNVKENL